MSKSQSSAPQSPMPMEDCSSTETDILSKPVTPPGEIDWAERRKPYRQQNLTPLQRKRLAEGLRSLRRLRYEEEQ